MTSFGPSLRWNLFDGGRLRNRVRSLEANAEAAQTVWEQTLLRAQPQLDISIQLLPLDAEPAGTSAPASPIHP